MAINFVKNDDIRILRDIEQYYATQIDEMPMNGKFFCFIYVENIGFLNIYSYSTPTQTPMFLENLDGIIKRLYLFIVLKQLKFVLRLFYYAVL